MAEGASGVGGERTLNLEKGVATLRQHHVERAFTAAQRIRLERCARRYWSVKRPPTRQRPICSRCHDRHLCSVGRLALDKPDCVLGLGTQLSARKRDASSIPSVRHASIKKNLWTDNEGLMSIYSRLGS